MDIFRPYQMFADRATYSWVDITPGSFWGNAVNFFIYDLLKITTLLLLVTFIMAVTRYYFPLEKVREILTQRRWYGLNYLLAALLGVVTPFCSCSSIPLFIGFLSAGIPLGVTFAFLISSPLVNEASLYLFPAIFGIKTTLLYNFVGVGIAVMGGVIIQKLGMEKYVREEFININSKNTKDVGNSIAAVPFKILAKRWLAESFGIIKKVFPYVLLGVALGAIIHGFVPESYITNTLSQKSWWVVPSAVIVGAPLYANSIGVIPIVEALIAKGIPMGTVLAFMTATVTISIPEGLMLARLMKRELLAMFFLITISGIVLMGYLFNLIL